MGSVQDDKILQAKCRLQKSHPFWSFLISYLKIREGKDGEMEMPTMGVKPDGTVLYNNEFVDKLSDDELKGVLAHEVGHLVFDSMERRGGRDSMGWNISTDVIINTVLLNDGFALPKGTIIPQRDHSGNDWSVKLPFEKPVEINGLMKKCAEDVYELLPKKKSSIGGKPQRKGKGSGDDYDNVKGFDNHLEGDKSKENQEGLEQERKKHSKEWKKRAIEAATFARMQGQLPAEIERLIGEMVNNKVSWKSLLRRFITNTVPNDWTYARPNKRSQAVGIYMPRLKKENTKIVVAIDTSGSIGQEELTTFTSEIVSIAKTLPHVELTVLQCDAKVHELMKVENGNIAKIKNMKIKGGGGTSFIPVFDKLKELQEDTKVLVYFTDGYGDFPDNKSYKWTTIWAVVKNGIQNDEFPFGKVVRLE